MDKISIIIIKKLAVIKMMKVVFVSEFFPPKIFGGGEINLAILAKTLAKKKVIVTVLTSYQDGLKDFEVIDDVEIYRWLKTSKEVKSVSDNLKRATSFPRSVVKEVKRLVKNIKPDLIHVTGMAIIAAKELSKLNIPLVATIESYPSLCPKGDRTYKGREECKFVCQFSKFISCQAQSPEIGKMSNKFYLKYNLLFQGYVFNYFARLRDSLKYCHLIAISEYMARILSWYGYNSTVIPNALELEKFRVFFDKKPVLPSLNYNPIILYMGSFIKSKGPQLLLAAIKGLNCRCKLYGSGVMKAELQKIIEGNNLSATIYDPVPYENIPGIYAEADIVVFPSLWPEPFGRISIEAMAAGKPIIAANVGAISETILPGTGLLFTPGSVQDLREKIIALLNDQQRCEELSINGKKEVIKYSGSVVAEKLIKEYERIISKK